MLLFWPIDYPTRAIEISVSINKFAHLSKRTKTDSEALLTIVTLIDMALHRGSPKTIKRGTFGTAE